MTGNELPFLCEGESECKGETGAGQFRFLVQLRKLSPTDSQGSKRIKNNVGEQVRMRVIARVLGCGKMGMGNLLKLAAGMFTGLAQEMQKGRRQASGVRRQASGVRRRLEGL